MARPTGAETVLSLTAAKDSTQTTLGGLNTIVGAVKFLFDKENLAVKVSNIVGGPYHVFVRSVMTTKSTSPPSVCKNPRRSRCSLPC